MRDFRHLGIYPGLEATVGAEVIAGNCPWSFPVGNCKPVFERLAEWFCGRGFDFFTTGMTGKVSSLSFHF